MQPSNEEESAQEVQPKTFSNSFLVKMETWDRYSTPQALRKSIAKQFPPPATNVPPAPILNGLVRLGKNPSTSAAFFAFDTEENQSRARELLRGMKYRAKQWEDRPVTERDLAVTHGGGAVVPRKRPREDNAQESQAPSVSPWMDVPYEDQLCRKKLHCTKVLKTISRYHYVPVAGLRDGSLFSGVEPSPVLVGYRNNVSLTCGRGADGTPMIGFQSGAVLEGQCSVHPADSIPTVHPVAVHFANVFANQVLHPLLQKDPTLTTMDKRNMKGFWRKMQIRHNKALEVMIDFEFGGEEYTEDQVQSTRDVLVQTFTSPENWFRGEEGSIGKVVSLQWCRNDGMSVATVEINRELLFGSSTLEESLLDCRFDLSPSAFFQVNREGMNTLLKRVIDVAHLDKERSVLLDLCCGTGTIGICLARYVRRVIGIEMVEAAVENAKDNMKKNSVTNAAFFAGKVEDVFLDVMKDAFETAEDREGSDIVAILDPPRSGLHPTVVKWLRCMQSIKRMVYISCEQRALEVDCEGLTKAPTNTYRGNPFVVVSAFGVDLFPHTHHVEMVVVLERSKE